MLWVPGVNRPWREVNHSPLSSAEVTNEWIRTSASSVFSWHGWRKVPFKRSFSGTGSFPIPRQKNKDNKDIWFGSR